MGPRLASKISSMRIGLWMEVYMGRILEEVAKLRVRKEDCIRNMSRCATMFLGPNILFDQIYFPWAGLISSKCQSMIRSSTHSLARSLTEDPPFFFEEASVMLRFPAIIIFSVFRWFRKDFKESQQTRFLENCTGT
jgi:hypothetical protein